jgi:hypothetical protein
MEWSLASTTVWIERAVALAVLLQSIELLQMRRLCSENGIWRWSILRREQRVLPFVLRWLFALLLPYPCFVALLVLRVVGAGALLAVGTTDVLPFLWLSQVAICVRFRGTFNGGSDYMTVLILLALSVATFDSHVPWLHQACLLYIAVQATLSYLIAGLAKLRVAQWRNGVALRGFVMATPFGPPVWAALLVRDARVCRLLAWGVMAFECLFPLVWVDARVCLAWLSLGLGFHVVNSLVFGLNRFLFAWAAAYPALFYCSHWLGRSG